MRTKRLLSLKQADYVKESLIKRVFKDNDATNLKQNSTKFQIGFFFFPASCTDVKQIFNSVTEHLQQNTQRKFQVAEAAYFMRWYEEQSYHIQQVVRQLVNSGNCLFF